jgi:hypothetical protein
MATCCKTNTCVEIIPSGCVRFTGTVVPNGLIDKQDYCDPYLNEIINLFDTTLTSLDKRVGLDKDAFDSANKACGINPVLDLTGFTVEDNKYYSSEIVQGLVGVICELRSRLNYLSQENIDTNSGNLHWTDLPLGDKFDLSCLSSYCDTGSILTLGQLLQAIIGKLCTCCP